MLFPIQSGLETLGARITDFARASGLIRPTIDQLMAEERISIGDRIFQPGTLQDIVEDVPVEDLLAFLEGHDSPEMRKQIAANIGDGKNCAQDHPKFHDIQFKAARAKAIESDILVAAKAMSEHHKRGRGTMFVEAMKNDIETAKQALLQKKARLRTPEPV
ncbi:MAG: hypothetical protein ACLFP8_08315 [Alphaproteobacteria bacterium]